MTIERFETDYSGKKVIVEYGRMAHQSGAAVTVQMGDTMVLASVCISGSAREGMDFFPLMVDYEERYTAVGKIKGPRFLKREGRPSTEAVLTGRMIDRGIRPLFPDGLRNEVQVVIMPLSVDGVNKPDIVGMIAATIALDISNVPFDGPVTGCSFQGEVRGSMLFGGGIAGDNKSVIAECSFSGNLRSHYYAGGIAGCNRDTINRCTTSGDIHGWKSGGLVSLNKGSLDRSGS